MTTFWTASEHEAPPKDKPFWAWLHDTGIRRMVWDEGSEEDEIDGVYVLDDGRFDDDYEPEFWAPIEAIPDPADEFAHLREDAA